MNDFDEMVDYYKRAYMWGFGASFDKSSPFSSNDARDLYMQHVRTCPKHHDPRGKRFGGCADVEESWFAHDVPPVSAD